jgi:hypothetical protein
MHILILAAWVALAPPIVPSFSPSASPVHGPQIKIWLHEAQREDGSWSALNVPPDLPGVHPGTATDDLWVTSVVTLSLLGDGHATRAGEHKDQVRRALEWVRAQQKEDGRLVTRRGRIDLLDHAMATLVLTEDLNLSDGAHDCGSASRALAYLESRALEAGGWNREGAAVGSPDPRTTVWASLAVASGREAGIEGEGDRLKAAWKSLFAYNADRAEVSPLDHACEALVYILSGQSIESQTFVTSVEGLLASPLPSHPSCKGYDPELVLLQSMVARQSHDWDWHSKVSNERGKRVWRMYKALGILGSPREDKPYPYLLCDPALTRGGSVAAEGFTILSLQMVFKYSTIIGMR